MSGLSKNDFPADWISQGVKRTQKIIESLDTEFRGVISWKSLCTLLCLFDAPIPTQAEIDEYAQNLMELSENGEIEAEAFARVRVDIENFFIIFPFSVLHSLINKI